MLRVGVLCMLASCVTADVVPVTDDPPACGDGVVSGAEQCDGATIPMTCAELGYYAGAPTCTSACALDAAGCSGRCGDLLVQADHGEVCDGARPTSGSCVAAGHDYGILRCSSSCAPDLAGSCEDYGWQPLFGTTAILGRVAANRRGAIAIEGTAGDIIINWDGVLGRRANPGWTEVAANGPHLIAIGAQSYGWFDGAWHEQTLSVGPAPAAATTSTGLAYLIQPDCTTVRLVLSTGVTTSLPTPATSCATPVTVFDQLHVAASTAGILRWTGTAWVTVLAAPATRIRRGIAEHLIADDGLAFSDVDLTFTPATSAPLTALSAQVSELATDVDGTLVALPDASAPVVFLERLRGAPRSLPDEVHGLARSEDGTVIAYGRGAYRFEPQPIVPSPGLPAGTQLLDLASLADGAIAYCGDVIGWIDRGTGDGARPWSGPACERLVGDPRTAHFILAAGQVFRWDPTTSQYVDEGLGGASHLAGTSALPFAIIGDEVWARPGASWSAVAIPASCTALDVVGIPGALYALARCASPSTSYVVLRWDGAGFVSIATTPEPFQAGSVLGDGTLLVTGVTTRRVEGTTFVDVPVTGRAYGASRDDFFVEPAIGGSLVHLQGPVSSEVRVSTGDGAVVEVSPKAIYAWDPLTAQLQAVPRTSLRLPTIGL